MVLKQEKINFNIAENIKSIRFDIGLSYCAPNSAVWLTQEPEKLHVIGVEPNPECINNIKQNGLYCVQKGIKPFHSKNFQLIECALDNVEEPQVQQFYCTARDPGTSSLLKPTLHLGNPVKSITEVTTTSFYNLLQSIDYNRFEYVELVKIDTQGKDLDIIKSAGEYLDKIVFLNCEVNTFNHYEGNFKPDEINQFLQSKNFIKLHDNSYVANQVVDSTYINKKFLDLKDKIDYTVL